MDCVSDVEVETVKLVLWLVELVDVDCETLVLCVRLVDCDVELVEIEVD